MIVEKSFPIKTEFSPIQDTTLFAGILPFLKLLVDGEILHRLPGERLRSQGWLDGQMVLVVMVLNLLGFDPVSDIERLEEDRVLCRMVRKIEPHLFGCIRRTLKGRHREGRKRTFPSPRSVRDWLERCHDEAAGKRRVRGEAWIPPPSVALKRLHRINGAMMSMTKTRYSIQDVRCRIPC